MSQIVDFFGYSAVTGARVAGLGPALVFFKRRNVDGSISDLSGSQPAITDQGAGKYEFTIGGSLLPGGTKILYVVDMSADSATRYLQGSEGEALSASVDIIDFFVFAAAGGALLAGLSPVLSYYQRRNSDGSLTDLIGSAPSITDKGGGLYELQIPNTDRPLGSTVEYEIDCTAASASRYLNGESALDGTETVALSFNDIWPGIEDALRTWVKSSTGLDDDHVIWSDQTGKRPTNAYATLRIGALVPIGSVDEVAMITDLGQSAGREIELKVTGSRRFNVSVQLFTPATVSGSSALALLANVQLALGLPTVRQSLADAGITPFDSGAPQNVSALSGTKFEGRSTLEVGFYTLATASEYTGFIEHCTPENYMGPPDLGTRDDIDI